MKKIGKKVNPSSRDRSQPPLRSTASSASKSAGAKSKIVSRTKVQQRVTKHAISDLAAQEKLEIFRLFMDAATDSFTIWDSQLNLVEFNQATLQYFPPGTEKKEVIGKNLLEFEPYIKETGQWDRYIKVMETGEPFITEVTGVQSKIAQITENLILNVKVFKVHNGLGMITTDITERKQAEALSAGQSQMLEMIAANTPLEEVLTNLTLFIEAQSEGMLCSVLLLDEDGQRMIHGAAPSLPDAYFKAVDGSLIGPRAGSCGTAMYRREPVIVTDILHDPLWEDYPSLVALAAQHGLRACWSTPITSHQGMVLGSFAAYYREVRGPHPAETRLIATATHIARIAIERKQAEQTLRESEELYRLITDSSNDTIGLIDFQGLTIFVSPAVRQMMGLDPAQVIGVNAFEYVHPEDQPASLAAFRRALDGDTVTFLHRGRHADGTWRWLEGWGRVIQFRGKPHILAVSRDITERKRVDAALRASEERYHALYDDTPSMYFTVDPDGIVLSVNQYGAAYLGYSPEELIGQSVLRVFLEDDRETAARNVAECFEHPGQMYNLELRKTRKDGSLLWVKETARAVLNQTRELVVLIVCEDITERKRAETALSETEEKYRNIFENAVEGIYQTLTDGRILNLNPALARIMGYDSPAEMIASISDIAHQYYVIPELREQFHQMMQERDEVHGFEYQAYRKDGSKIWVSDNARAVRDPDGTLLYFEGFITDITERKRAEQALREREQHAQSLLRLSQNLERAQTYAETLSAALEEVKSILGYQNLWVYLLTEDKKHFNALIARGVESESAIKEETATLTIKGDRMLEEIAEAEHIVVVEDARIDERTNKEIVESLGLITVVNIPIILFDRHMGCIGTGTFGGEGVRVPTMPEQEYLTALASHMAVTLDRIHLLTERKQAEQTLRESEEKYRTLIQKIQAAVIVHGADTQILTSNSMAQELLGLSEDQMLGKTAIDQAWHFFLEDGTVMPLEKYPINLVLETRKALKNYVARVHRPNKKKDVWVLVNADPIFGKQDEITQVIVTFIEITERKQAEEDLRKSEKRYHGLFEDSPISLWEEDFSLVKQRLDVLRQEGVKDFAAFFDAHPEVVAECASQIKLVDINNATLKLFNARTKGELRKNLVQVIMNDNFEGFRNELVMIANGEFDFHWEEPNRTVTGDQIYTHFHWSVAPGFEETLSRVIISITDITQRKQHERELEVIVTVSNALRTASTRAEMVPVILEQLLHLLGADGSAFAIREANSGETVFEFGLGDFARSIGLHIPAGVGVTGHVINMGVPYVTKDIRADPHFVQSDLLGNIRAVACVPLIAQGESIGALLVGRKTEVTEQQLRLLVSIGDIAANAIHRATLFEQTERRLEHLTALNDIDRAITSSFDLQQNLSTLLAQVILQLRVDAADVLMFDPASQILECSAGRGFTTNIFEGMRLKLGDGFAGRAASEHRTINIPGSKEPPQGFVRTALWRDEAFMSYYGVPLLAKGQLKGVLEIFNRTPIQADEEWLNFLHSLAEQATIAIDNATLFDDLQRSNTELTLAYDATIQGWSHALDLRDKETEGHTQRVTVLTVELAKAMGMAEAELVHIHRGALLHDIGKMGVPDHILLKPDTLTDDEFVQMRKHPTYAYDMLSHIDYLRKALDIPHYHHENWDGTGYPQGIKGTGIPFAARIFAVVDVYDALTSNRPYRAGWSKQKTLEYIRSQSGSQFDPEVVDAFIKLIR